MNRKSSTYPVCGRKETDDMSRRDCQDHGYIEDYVDTELIPLNPVERRQIRLWSVVCATFWVAAIAAAVYVGSL